VELSHVVEDGMTTFPGLPAPAVRDHMSHADSRDHYAQGTEFQIGEISMVANTGTYLDAPFHRFRDGADVSCLPLERLVGLEGVLVEAPEEAREGGRGVGEALLDGLELEGRAVLIATGWSSRWGTAAYGDGHAFLTAAAARRLAEAGAALLGVDSLNVDDTEDPERPAHTALLGAGIPIVENLRGLEALAGRRFRFTAVPLRVRGMGSFPVRAFAELR
jgi:kynurenine formamidase